MDNNELREYLKNNIEQITGWKAMFASAIDVKLIPYITFDITELPSDDDGKHMLELTIDAWDKHTTSNIIEKIDKVDKRFKKYKDLTDTFLIQIFLGSNRQLIEDEDKSIKRLHRKYDIIIHERKQ